MNLPEIKGQAAQFRAPTELAQQLYLRAPEGSSLGSAARELALRALALLARGRVELEGVFSVAEMQLMCEATNGTIFDAGTLYALPFGIEDHIALNLADERWGVDKNVLMEKLRALFYPALWALVDALERFWTHPELYSADEAGFAALGVPVRSDDE